MSGSLTLVGTPIGNLSDFSPRAVAALESCDVIAAEDTRVTLKLLNHFGIKKPLVSYYEHNKQQRSEPLCARMEAGEHVVLVSDAGMPAISDPGEDLVNECHRRGIPVHVVPGATAMATAIAVSGQPTGRFTFEGFLSVTPRDRREHLDSLRGERRTMIFYEAPHKLVRTLEDLRDAFGADRGITVVRELTKLHEEILPTTLGEACLHFQQTPPKGEFVLVVAGAVAAERQEISLETAIEMAKGYVAEGMRAADAAKRAALETGCRKGEIYKGLV
ncbi:MAG: 16S rRNA (cytidine(1402)-2'-O)-methyltransferase [Clostridia bacterium]|nr:16S rRNA (cytidine(1402)-2'-O)-methyltransferase [Clostridia bacterium]